MIPDFCNLSLGQSTDMDELLYSNYNSLSNLFYQIFILHARCTDSPTSFNEFRFFNALLR